MPYINPPLTFLHAGQLVSIRNLRSHAFQPEPDGRTYVVESLDGISDVRDFLLKHACLDEAVRPAASRCFRSVALRNGDRVIRREKSDGDGVPDHDVLVIVVDYRGYSTERVAAHAHQLPKPELSLEDAGLNVSQIVAEQHPPPEVKTDEGSEYYVDRILDYREGEAGREYRVLWAGYPCVDASWIGEAEAESLAALDRWQIENSIPMLRAKHTKGSRRLKQSSAGVRCQRCPVEGMGRVQRQHNPPAPNNHREARKDNPTLRTCSHSGIVRSQSQINSTAPQYRYVTPIEDSKVLDDLVERSLDSSITLSTRELLAVAPEVRKVVRERITGRRMPTANGTTQNAPVSNTTAANNLVESFLQSGLPRSDSGLIVAREMETIRTIDVTLDGHLKTEAIVDDGSQIVSMSRKLWQKLTKPLDLKVGIGAVY
ncbi:hypothetical protein D9611_011793 [Ephemerocybe angulata]|uniref:Chromo domain-containing protein n=1 Tax=Ephemerocybe angulata TaxID=980116 RepID=A0A8H5FFV4_9AGAR|nr:hypothetical protein D9611_011793 [Tulosesus angulatus]